MAKKKGDKGPSKMAMVREALGELGADAKPADLGAWAKAKYGAEINPQMLSAYKSSINGKGAGKSSTKARIGVSNKVRIDDVIAVKGLIERVGAKELSELVKALG